MAKDNHLNAATTTPTCKLKMNLNCCEQCPIRLQKRLLKMNGVKSVEIDQRQGMVTVAGDVDPVTFPENVTKLGKKAELWSFQKDPSSAPSSLKDCCSCHGDSTASDGEDDVDGQNPPGSRSNAGLLITWQRPEQQKTKDKKKKKEEEKKKQETKSVTKRTKMMNLIPAAGAGKDLYFHGPPWPMGFHRPLEPPFPYGYDRPRPAWAPPECPFDHGVGVGVGSGSGFRSWSPPKVNRMMKYSSYADNYLPY